MSRGYKCPHMENIIQLSLPELCKLKQGLSCSQCDARGPNLWICLYKNCLDTGCSEQSNDHSTKHFKLNQIHCIHMNLSSQRIWCYLCEAEVFLSQRRGSLASSDSNNSRYSGKIYASESVDASCDEDDDDRRHMDGLVGLQNIANTCYMNAALQALSNSPPLTSFFLECGDIIEATSEFEGNQRKPGLAKSYHRLIKDMWCRNKRSYIIPRSILYGIRNVHPMFRGFQQHDTQEFLRCFMDQLHEELKEVTPPPPDILLIESSSTVDEDNSTCTSPSPSPSEAEYETCDSGVSEQSSLSDERPSNRRSYYSHSSSPNLNRRNVPPLVSSGGYHKGKSSSKFPHRSIISDVFDGKLLSSVQCLTCDRISTREETFQDLSLPIPGKDHLAVLHQSQGINVNSSQLVAGVTYADVLYQGNYDGWFWWIWNWLRSWFWGPSISLHDCMAAFFSADELKGDNMYSCEKCNKLRNGIKYSRVLALPEMLCVHLKRFRHDLSYSSKISSPVHFPLTGLDMRPYLHKNCQSQISTYDLTAVICHHGTVGGGHYTSFAKHELRGKWFEFDDQLVTEVTPEIVQNCQAYVLFYRKSNPQMIITRAQAQELSDTNPPQASDIRFFVSRQWINRFNTFAEPGPIDNWALLCPHGGLPPCKVNLVSRLVVPLPQPLWDFLYKKFGGGPACNHLFECDTCRIAAESLSRRQKFELETFTQYNDEFQYQESCSTIYAISMEWLRQWQLFAREATNEEPGPINNSTIAAVNESIPIKNVKPGSDYAQINTTLWTFFQGIYGGGPEIILRGDPTDEIKSSQNEKAPFDHMEVDQDVIETEVAEQKEDTVSIDQTPLNLDNQSKIKNVTFEYETEFDNKYSKDDNLFKSNSANSSKVSTASKKKAAFKRNKYYNSSEDHMFNSPHIKILGEKDKRSRGAMKSSGFFGPEGKYCPQRYYEIPSDNIPDSPKQPISYSQTNTDPQTLEQIYGNHPLFQSNLIEMPVKLQENEQLNSSEMEIVADDTQNHKDIVRGNGKSLHRKKFRSKYDKKMVSYTNQLNDSS